MKALLLSNSDWSLFNFRRPFIERLRREGFEVVLVTPPGDYVQRLQAAGFVWRPLPLDRRSLNPLREALVVLRLARLYAEERPDIVHHFTLKCVVYGALAARLAGVPRVVSAIEGLGYVFSSPDRMARLLQRIVRPLLRLALALPSSLATVHNEDDARELVAGGLADPSRIRLIKSAGVDTARFAPQATAPLSGEVPRVLLACRLLWGKGVGTYVEAARLLKASGPAARFQLAGAPDPGNPDSVSAADVERWAGEGDVVPLGHVDDMAGLLATTDIFVLPSDREGLPTGLIEAASCALPLVATDVPGCRDVVRDGVTGLLVPPRDAAALAAAIRRLIADPERARRLGRAARALVLAEFDQTIVIERTLAVYGELLGAGWRRTARDDVAVAVTSTPVPSSSSVRTRPRP